MFLYIRFTLVPKFKSLARMYLCLENIYQQSHMIIPVIEICTFKSTSRHISVLKIYTIFQLIKIELFREKNFLIISHACEENYERILFLFLPKWLKTIVMANNECFNEFVLEFAIQYHCIVKILTLIRIQSNASFVNYFSNFLSLFEFQFQSFYGRKKSIGIKCQFFGKFVSSNY